MKVKREFEKRLGEIAPKLYAIAYKLNGKYTVLNDKDLYQEAVLYLWQKWNENVLEDKTDSYILQGCYYYLKNYLRKTCKKTDIRSVSLNEAVNNNTQEFEEILTSEDSRPAFEIIDGILLKEDVEKDLTSREKEIFKLLFANFTTREIGKKLHISHVMVIKVKNKIKEKCHWLKKKYS